MAAFMDLVREKLEDSEGDGSGEALQGSAAD
jgi:hypothetical protein